MVGDVRKFGQAVWGRIPKQVFGSMNKRKLEMILIQVFLED